MITLGEEGEAEYEFEISSAGIYDVAIRISFPSGIRIVFMFHLTGQVRYLARIGCGGHTGEQLVGFLWFLVYFFQLVSILSALVPQYQVCSSMDFEYVRVFLKNLLLERQSLCYPLANLKM